MRLLIVLLLGFFLGGTCAAAEVARELGWEDLTPDGQVTAMKAFSHAQLSQPDASFSPQQAPGEVVRALDGQYIKLPGYVVPLELDEHNRVVEFLLVPVEGACIHLPPPPFNQIVHVTTEQGLNPNRLGAPYWVIGTLQVETVMSDVGRAGYAMKKAQIENYSSLF
jgi:uncharacterized protein